MNIMESLEMWIKLTFMIAAAWFTIVAIVSVFYWWRKRGGG